LPFGTPEAVADEVKRRIDDLAPGGGFVFAPVHNVQAGVPVENTITMFRTALEYGVYQ
jgi:uroporphyrinogen decarboxylase